MSRRLVVAQPWITLLARLLLAGVFAAAGWPKLLDSEGTVRSVRAFQLMPEVMVRPFAYGLPPLELVLAVLLLIGLGTRWAALITAGLLVMFLFGITAAWARGLSIDCGCFGNAGSLVVDPVPGYIRDLLRDLGFLLAAGFVVRWPRTRLSLDAALGLAVPSTPAAAAPVPSRPRPRTTGQKPRSL